MPIGARSRARSAQLKKDIQEFAKKASKEHVPAELTDYAKKKAGTTSADVPGEGMAKKAAVALEKRKRMMQEY